MKRKFLTITLIATCLVTTACTAEPLNIVPGTSPTPGADKLRVTEAAGLVVRDDINITAPPGWEEKKSAIPDHREILKIARKDEPQSEADRLEIRFTSALDAYHSPHTYNLADPLGYAVENAKRWDGIKHDEKGVDLHPVLIDNTPARGYTLTHSDSTSERYFVLRSDGLWELSIYADGPIPPELRQAALSATWSEASEPNIPIPYRVSD
ncbi:hypothetical protein [Buchananella hordeovulneris]|uniref:hypothetical protein n=1 Tax=Buchananella hordeovulneris TaxID=52770 RepID=UPI0026DBD197|nr:hypothetical protein [Buchananella hordeovulneris]MDO5080137.1 hypothetical protein [Buchananella hordeovulneris]